MEVSVNTDGTGNSLIDSVHVSGTPPEFVVINPPLPAGEKPFVIYYRAKHDVYSKNQIDKLTKK